MMVTRSCTVFVACVLATSICVSAFGTTKAAASVRIPHHEGPPCGCGFATATTKSTALQWPRRGNTATPRTTRWRLAAKKYADKAIDQREILRELDATVAPYDGRLESKVSEASPAAPASAPHRCALVTLLGRPNAGKSTLLNALLADDFAITTPRPQTTRHALLGVLTTDRAQLCFTDTPGTILAPAYRLQEGMMAAVTGAVRDADVFLLVADARGGPEEEEEDEHRGLGEEVLEKLRRPGRPVIVCVNKVDLVTETRGDANTPASAVRAIAEWRTVLPDAFAILPMCAARGADDPGVAALRALLLADDDAALDVGAAVRGLGRPVPGMFRGGPAAPPPSSAAARALLPEGPPLYPPDFLTDRTERFCAAELVRETLFARLAKEVPYCCEVRIDAFDESRREAERKALVRIVAAVVVERDSQVGIVVGKGGVKIKEVGVEARRKLEDLLGVKVMLDLRVRVEKNWRNDEEKLKQYGYT